MTNFFYISGIIFWSTFALVAIYSVISFIWKTTWSTISNLKFYLVGAKWTKDTNMAGVYFNRYRNHPGTMKYFRSWKNCRRLAYYRLLKMAQADMPAYLEERRNLFNS